VKIARELKIKFAKTSEMESIVPGLTRAKLVSANSYNQSPIQIAVGLGNGAVECWDPASDSTVPRVRAHTAFKKVTNNETEQKTLESTYVFRTSSVTALEVVNARRVPPVIIAGTANGFVSQIYVQNQSMENLVSGPVHRGCVTEISWCIETSQVASSGEDGYVNIFDIGTAGSSELKTSQSLRVDGTTLNSVSWIDPRSVAAVGNSPGKQVILFDTREGNQGASATSFGVRKNLSRFFCLANHASNPNRLFTGADDGSISLWDLRNFDSPVLSEKVHEGMVTCLATHPTNPSVVLSGSEDGSVRFSSAEQSGSLLLRDVGIPILSLDTSTDELAGPMLLIASEDETATVEQLVLESYPTQTEAVGFLA